MKNGNPDVVVVGGGPTGLLTAGELRRRGLTVRLVEKHAQRQQLSKALVVQARTLEQMDLLGLAEQFLSRGYPAPGLNMSLGSHRPVSIGNRTNMIFVDPEHDLVAVARWIEGGAMDSFVKRLLASANVM
jgi:2-polyprenyl-6-methoxyphenol hydroxylase-like FAD-dependent oxidoreductase